MLPACDVSVMHRTIVVGIDGSDASHAALQWAVDAASDPASTLHVLTVVESTASPYRFSVTEIDEINTAATELVDDLVEAHRDRDVELVAAVRRGRAHTELLEYADEVDANLLVVGQRGVDGVEQMLLGSTADRVAQLASIPVVIVPAREGGR